MDDETVVVCGPADEPLLDAFYGGIYLDAFAHQVEPVAVWKRRLQDPEAPYKLAVRITGTNLRNNARAIHGGIVYERYPSSRCGLLTYMVVAPAQRRRGLGQRLLYDAIASLRSTGVEHVFGEVSNPAISHAADAWPRLERFLRWGARVVDASYVQPRLDPGFDRDRHLRLMMFPVHGPLGVVVSGAPIAAFLSEFFAITEGLPADDPEFRALQRGLDGEVSLLTFSSFSSSVS